MWFVDPSHRFCPTCGQPMPPKVGVQTVRLTPEEFAAVRPLAVRTPLPPPPGLPSVIVESPLPVLVDPTESGAGVETLPDAGWLRKHLRERERRARREFAPIVIIVLAFAVGLLAYALFKQ